MFLSFSSCNVSTVVFLFSLWTHSHTLTEINTFACLHHNDYDDNRESSFLALNHIPVISAILRCCICSRLTNSALRLNFTSCSRLFLPFLLNEFSTHLFVFIGNSTPLCQRCCHIVQKKLVWPFIVTSFNVAIWIYYVWQPITALSTIENTATVLKSKIAQRESLWCFYTEELW